MQFSSFVAAFFASFVECVEALTIFLAVGVTRGWKPAGLGATLGLLFLFILILIFGASLQVLPIQYLQTLIGVLLLLFGLRWLRKAILRAAGAIALHDEELTFSRESQRLKSMQIAKTYFFNDPIAVATSFKAIVLEGLEVVFIVLALGNREHGFGLPALAAGAAFVLVALLGIGLHKPLSRIPENQLKFAVGILLSSFGIYWTAEGLGYRWELGDMALLIIALALAVLSIMAVRIIRMRRKAKAGD